MRILLLAAAFVLAQLTTTAQSVTVGGEVLTPLTLTAANLTAMPRSTAVSKDKQGVPHTFSGVALADIFKKAGVTTGRELRGENLAKYVLVTCADNYQVVFSLAELDSSFTDRVVILADQVEGKPLPAGTGPFRIVVPGEKKPARNCFQVLSIDIKFAKK
ncbi:molybdopterin-dependent oxidoreductase [Puia sp.]|jgi:DMSO/TMAO reductase YedYZ molybdopterin-dependent catalytic subunit|uniref:molybdopterin-dependent oxidoreductase n=1 Tax=Puia sp. TaxID=2045100 RepID=UPI002F3ECE10